MAKNLGDFPELKAVFDRLMEEKAKLLASTQHLHDEYDKLQVQYDPINNRMREVAKEWQAIERPRLIEIDTQLAAIARATGGMAVGIR